MKDQIRITFDILKGKKSPDGTVHVEAIVSDTMLDSHWDRFSKGALDSMKEQLEAGIDLLNSHDDAMGFGKSTKAYTKPIEGVEGEHTLYAEFKLDKNNSMATALGEEVLTGNCVKQFSVGGRIDRSVADATYWNDHGDYVINALDLDHVALTRENNAANSRTAVVGGVVKNKGKSLRPGAITTIKSDHFHDIFSWGMTSKSNGHTHEVSKDGRILAAEDGHTHEIASEGVAKIGEKLIKRDVDSNNIELAFPHRTEEGNICVKAVQEALDSIMKFQLEDVGGRIDIIKHFCEHALELRLLTDDMSIKFKSLGVDPDTIIHASSNKEGKNLGLANLFKKKEEDKPSDFEKSIDETLAGVNRELDLEDGLAKELGDADNIKKSDLKEILGDYATRMEELFKARDAETAAIAKSEAVEGNEADKSLEQIVKDSNEELFKRFEKSLHSCLTTVVKTLGKDLGKALSNFAKANNEVAEKVSELSKSVVGSNRLDIDSSGEKDDDSDEDFLSKSFRDIDFNKQGRN